jgi:glyoxylase-like metal-dependent hydrolase (beta-lactamase superfamily II)
MGETAMKKIHDDLYTWHIFNEEKKLNFNGLYLKAGGSFILIDPPPMSNQDREFVEQTGKPKNIYLTNKHHTRASVDCRHAWGSRIYVHEKDQPLMEITVDGTFADGDLLEGELKVVHIPHAKTPGESGLYWEKNKTLIVGDAVIGKPEGGLSMLADEKFKDPKLARQGLNLLLEFDFDTLLVGDGTSILKDAKRVLEIFLG